MKLVNIFKNLFVKGFYLKHLWPVITLFNLITFLYRAVTLSFLNSWGEFWLGDWKIYNVCDRGSNNLCSISQELSWDGIQASDSVSIQALEHFSDLGKRKLLFPRSLWIRDGMQLMKNDAVWQKNGCVTICEFCDILWFTPTLGACV